ncbi:MAG: hypothetical protein ACKOCW_14820, partial [Planctomycetaceae bacterium]
MLRSAVGRSRRAEPIAGILEDHSGKAHNAWRAGASGRSIMSIKVVIADDHEVVRRGLNSLLA